MSETLDEALILRTTGTSVGFLTLAPASASMSPALVPTNMPVAIPADQAYYWSVPWQDDVREAMEALARGDYVEFSGDDPDDVVRWFLSDDA